MKKNSYYFVAVTALLVIFTISCGKINKITDSITKPTAREVYLREIKTDKITLNDWEAAYANAQRDSISIELPYVEKGAFAANSFSTYSYNVSMREGEVLIASVSKDSLAHRVFIDVFEATTTGFKHLKSNEPSTVSVELPIDRTADYKVVIQPELKSNSNFYSTIEKKPLYGFPVAGKGNSAILSFWGYERDGGRRTHEGVDVFAPRGTPVVAVAEGRVGYTGEKGLGGKQVWLRTGMFGKSVYYAHLDSIAATEGEKVMPGDTLGFVGSTGNAKGGKPHLHFGIYGNGAVDPLPYIFTQPKTVVPSLTKLKRSFNTQMITVKGPKANLRKSASTSAAIFKLAAINDTLKLLGESNGWLHVATQTGQKAYLHTSVVKELK